VLELFQEVSQKEFQGLFNTSITGIRNYLELPSASIDACTIL